MPFNSRFLGRRAKKTLPPVSNEEKLVEFTRKVLNFFAIFIGLILLVGIIQVIWAFILNPGSYDLQRVNFSQLAIICSIISLIASAFIFQISIQLQNQGEELSEHLFRSWPGFQTDYSASLRNTHKDPPLEIVKHIDDIERGFDIPNSSSLNEACFMLSSLAYGIEHSANTVDRFISVLERVAKHPPYNANTAIRTIKIAIWPLIEHRAIWGAEREIMIQQTKKGAFAKIPSIEALVSDKTDVAWTYSLPAWCRVKERFTSTLTSLRKLGHFFEYCHSRDAEIKLEVDEIEPWSGRSFYLRYGRDSTFTLLIITTPINSSILSANHWTSMGFHSEKFESYKQLSHIYSTCVKGRYSYSELSTSSPDTDSDFERQNSDSMVRRTRQFLEKPYKTLGDYFILPDGWEHWESDGLEEKKFFYKIQTFSDRESS